MLSATSEGSEGVAKLIDLAREAEWRWADLAELLDRIDHDRVVGDEAGPARAVLERLYGSIEHTCTDHDGHPGRW